MASIIPVGLNGSDELYNVWSATVVGAPVAVVGELQLLLLQQLSLDREEQDDDEWAESPVMERRSGGGESGLGLISLPPLPLPLPLPGIIGGLFIFY